MASSFSIISAVTDQGRQRMAQSLLEGGAKFDLTHFVVGNGGHDPDDSAVALTPDVTLTTLPSITFGPTAIGAIVLASNTCPQATCSLADADAVGELSNIGLIATIVYPPTDPDLGQQFLFAIGNFPLRNKPSDESADFLVPIAF